MNPLQSQEHGNKHYNSQYAGEDGAVEVSRRALLSAWKKFALFLVGRVASEVSVSVDEHRERLIAIKHELTSHISTLCSAILPALKKLRFKEAFGLVRELRTTLNRLKELGYDDLSPTQMEVTIAGLSKAWVVTPLWAEQDALVLAEKILVHPKSSRSTVLLTMARFLRLHHPDLHTYYRALRMADHVRRAVDQVFDFGLTDGLEWSTVARLADMVGMTSEMHRAAMMDGRPDVLIKYGPFLASWNARIKTWQT